MKWNRAIGFKDWITVAILLGLALSALIISGSLPSADALPSALPSSPSSPAMLAAPVSDEAALTQARPRSPLDMAVSSGRLARFSR